MSRRRRRRRGNHYAYPTIAIILLAAGGWYFWPALWGEPDGSPARNQAGPMSAPAVAGEVPIAVIGDAPTMTSSTKLEGSRPSLDDLDQVGANADEEADGDDEAQAAFVALDEPPARPQPAPGPFVAAPATPPATPVAPADDDTQSSGERLSTNMRVDAALKRYEAGQRIEARGELNRILQSTSDAALQREVRRHLTRIADETIFSRDIVSGDPLFERYEIQSGDYLITIGKKFAVPYELIMTINGISDPGRIRAGQSLKVPRGPFHAKIYRSEFRLELYLQDVFVRSFPVALGRDSGTPLGKWKVGQRLTNPTYYPSASAEKKEIIAADDPSNPLGERWIALEGIEGDAVGQEGFGIHGTIEPDSIGKPASAGCVRMHNDDVALVYQALQSGASTVLTLP